eukprot:CAMPEP_0172524642 /NCGR_PEP_ID=MMETSP1066-20121228/294297_1 /TAXON_ID=671091 /ORGANISM="Coscinodiscus wailesii, Strain CCMP2513" /LENGTH=1040 /DNA_ID=CAMNT_0013307785 /DNA_START=447 /DNA_END=3569 /DNA_ORIENTATION=-
MAQQDTFLRELRQSRDNSDDITVLGQTYAASNAIFLSVPESSIPVIENDDRVLRVATVSSYEIDSSDSSSGVGDDVPLPISYGSDNSGRDLTEGAINGNNNNNTSGNNILVAIFDTGIDYTHIQLGGTGTTDAYRSASLKPMIPSSSRDFPNEIVTAGHDFVGDEWDGYGALRGDEDPIDLKGHGTKVAGVVRGVAPGASLLAVKVCSSRAVRCSGVALMRGVDYAIEMGVDIINLSLGSAYGQPFDDDLSYALKNAHDDFGILSVAAGGNFGNKPYCTGTPGSEPSVLSVGQMMMPNTAFVLQITAAGHDGRKDKDDDADSFTVYFNDWSSPPDGPISAPLTYGGLGCDPFPAGSLTGYIVLVDRALNECFEFDQVVNIENAGGVAALIGNERRTSRGKRVQDLSAQDFAFDLPDISAFSLDRGDTDIVKAVATATDMDGGDSNRTVTISQKLRVAGRSSRGPDMSYNAIKPEIVSPGSSHTAVAGTGWGTGNFKGSSAAAPAVAGAAAVMLSHCRQYNENDDENCSPLAIKSQIMNHANREIYTADGTRSAGISRVGAGGVVFDENWAFDNPFWAYCVEENQPKLSLGLVDGAEDTVIHRLVRIVSKSDEKLHLEVTSVDHRQQLDDIATKKSPVKIKLEKHSKVTLSPHSQIDIPISFHFKASLLPNNHMSSGRNGTNPITLDANEFSGHILITDRSKATPKAKAPAALPWHAIARRASLLTIDQTAKTPTTTTTLLPNPSATNLIKIKNRGAGTAQITMFEILALSDQITTTTTTITNSSTIIQNKRGQESPTPDIKAVSYRTIPTSVCPESQTAIQFAITTWERITFMGNVQLLIEYNYTTSDGGTTKKTRIYSAPVRDGHDNRVATWTSMDDNLPAQRRFYIQHATNSANVVLTACTEDVGLFFEGGTAADNAELLAVVRSLDDLFDGPGDEVTFRFAPFRNSFVATVDDVAAAAVTGDDLAEWDMESGGESLLRVEKSSSSGGDGTSLGVALLSDTYRDEGRTGAATKETELLLILRSGVDEPLPVGGDGRLR